MILTNYLNGSCVFTDRESDGVNEEYYFRGSVYIRVFTNHFVLLSNNKSRII